MPTHCPACKKPVPPQAEDCPHCPMSFRQQEQVHPSMRGGVGKRLSQHPLFLPGLLVGAALGLWRAGQWVIQSAGAEGEESPFEQIIRQRGWQAEGLGDAGNLGTPAKAVLRSGAGTGQETSGIALERPEDSVVVEEGGGATVIGAPGAAEEEVREWRLRGRVYDLVTLEALPRCPMIFADEGSAARLESASDAQGRYRVAAPPLKGRGYAVAVRCPGYAASYLNPGTEGVRQMSEEDRRALAADIAKSLDAPYTVQAYGSKPLVTDFYLAPLPK